MSCIDLTEFIPSLISSYCLLMQVILFSDILTPLSGMNIPFDIVKGKGPVIFNPLLTSGDVDQVREFVPEDSVPYVGEALTILRKEVSNVLFQSPTTLICFSFLFLCFFLFLSFFWFFI